MYQYTRLPRSPAALRPECATSISLVCASQICSASGGYQWLFGVGVTSLDRAICVEAVQLLQPQKPEQYKPIT
jgi:hypothetical protein